MIQQTFIEQVYMLTVIYKRAHIRFMIFKCGIYFILFFGLDSVLDVGLVPDHFAKQTLRALLPMGEYYM